MENELIKVLKPYKQWVTHDEKKRPFQVGTGHFADVTDPNTWSSYDTVKDCKRKGFVLTENDPFTVIDLDHCIKSQGRIKSETSKILMYFQSYTEVSPSGTGFHIWVQGKISSAIKREMFEIYSHARYITITENSTFNCLLANCQLQLDRIFEKYGRVNLFEREDFEVEDCHEDLRKLYKVSLQLRRIWDLDCGFLKADGSPDCSSYDMALAGLLRDWSGKQIMWALKFFREQHGFAPKHEKALQMTIAKALENKDLTS
jgi:primase-polymerase (primpol)-like protein